MASTCEHTHGASAPRPRRAAVRAGSHHAPASAAISASAWPPRRRPQLVTSLKRRPTKISEQNRNSEYEMHLLADAKNALTKPLALISFCYCFVSRFRQGRFFRGAPPSRWASPALRSSAELGTQLPLVPKKDLDRDTIVRKTTLRPFERATSRPGLSLEEGVAGANPAELGKQLGKKLGELGSWLGELPSWTRRAAQLWGAFFS